MHLSVVACFPCRGFPAAGSPSLHNSREHTSPNFLSMSVNTNPISVCGSPIREFSSVLSGARDIGSLIGPRENSAGGAIISRGQRNMRGGVQAS